MHDHGPQERWRTITFVAALRVTRLTAAGLLDGPRDGDRFLAYLDQLLVPTLHPRDIVVMDNWASHHVERVRERIEAAGAQLWNLPPCSRDLNPIELWFATLKAPLRTERRRTVEELGTAVAARLPLFSATEYRNYFRHCRYAPTTPS